jgi:hypothetical protein
MLAWPWDVTLVAAEGSLAQPVKTRSVSARRTAPPGQRVSRANRWEPAATSALLKGNADEGEEGDDDGSLSSTDGLLPCPAGFTSFVRSENRAASTFPRPTPPTFWLCRMQC